MQIIESKTDGIKETPKEKTITPYGYSTGNNDVRLPACRKTDVKFLCNMIR